jgi:hypothetical protein
MRYDASGLSVCSRLCQTPIEVVVVGLDIKRRLPERNVRSYGHAQRLENSLCRGDVVRGQLVD